MFITNCSLLWPLPQHDLFFYFIFYSKNLIGFNFRALQVVESDWFELKSLETCTAISFTFLIFSHLASSRKSLVISNHDPHHPIFSDFRYYFDCSMYAHRPSPHSWPGSSPQGFLTPLYFCNLRPDPPPLFISHPTYWTLSVYWRKVGACKFGCFEFMICSQSTQFPPFLTHIFSIFEKFW